MIHSPSTKINSPDRTGGRTDLGLSAYLRLTDEFAGTFKPLTFRQKAGLFVRFLKDWSSTAREAARESLFFARHTFPRRQVPPEIAQAFLRKRGHVLEKNLMGLHGELRKEEKMLVARQARELMEGLAEAPQEKLDNTLPWVIRLLKELEWNRKENWTCDKLFVPNEKESRYNDLAVIMKRRRSVRAFQEKPVPEEIVRQIVEAATWAPSSCNRQPWHFITITDPSVIDLVTKSSGGAGFPWMFKAPLLIMTVIDVRVYRILDDRLTAFQDGAIANEHMLLMADALNLGGCWVTYNSFSNKKNMRAVRERLNIPPHMVFCGIMAIGYPAQWVCPITKLSVDRVLHKETFPA